MCEWDLSSANLLKIFVLFAFIIYGKSIVLPIHRVPREVKVYGQQLEQH